MCSMFSTSLWARMRSRTAVSVIVAFRTLVALMELPPVAQQDVFLPNACAETAGAHISIWTYVCYRASQGVSSETGPPHSLFRWRRSARLRRVDSLLEGAQIRFAGLYLRIGIVGVGVEDGRIGQVGAPGGEQRLEAIQQADRDIDAGEIGAGGLHGIGEHCQRVARDGDGELRERKNELVEGELFGTGDVYGGLDADAFELLQLVEHGLAARLDARLKCLVQFGFGILSRLL